MSFDVNVDLTNPGQFFACCGLFELATRLGPATAHFSGYRFHVETDLSLQDVVDRLCSAPLVDVDENNPKSTALDLGAPFELRLDWWLDRRSGGQALKVWAGSMEGGCIARAMVAALRGRANEALFDWGKVVFDPDARGKKREPFYFDARRAPNAHSRDVGFSPNRLRLETTAFPAVEALCLIGLQRFRPAALGERLFEYRSWSQPFSARVVSVLVNGILEVPGTRAWRFETSFRTEYHKAFRPSTLVSQGA